MKSADLLNGERSEIFIAVRTILPAYKEGRIRIAARRERCNRRRVGDDGEATRLGKFLRKQQGRRAGVDEQRIAWLEKPDGTPRDRAFGFRILQEPSGKEASTFGSNGRGSIRVAPP